MESTGFDPNVMALRDIDLATSVTSTIYIKVQHILIPPKQVSRIYFLFHVFEAFVEAVGDDGAALGLEGGEVVHHAAAEEGGAVVEGGFVNYHFRTLGLHALHDALDGRLAEVVGVALHSKAVDADGWRIG